MGPTRPAGREGRWGEAGGHIGLARAKLARRDSTPAHRRHDLRRHFAREALNDWRFVMGPITEVRGCAWGSRASWSASPCMQAWWRQAESRLGTPISVPNDSTPRAPCPAPTSGEDGIADALMDCELAAQTQKRSRCTIPLWKVPSRGGRVRTMSRRGPASALRRSAGVGMSPLGMTP